MREAETSSTSRNEFEKKNVVSSMSSLAQRDLNRPSENRAWHEALNFIALTSRGI